MTPPTSSPPREPIDVEQTTTLLLQFALTMESDAVAVENDDDTDALRQSARMFRSLASALESMVRVDLDSKRAKAFLGMLVEALTKARDVGGPNATMHVGDVLGLAEGFQSGAMDAKLDDLPPVAGPFYPRDHQ